MLSNSVSLQCCIKSELKRDCRRGLEGKEMWCWEDIICSCDIINLTLLHEKIKSSLVPMISVIRRCYWVMKVNVIWDPELVHVSSVGLHPELVSHLKDCGQFLFSSNLERNLVFSAFCFCLVCADLVMQVNIFFCSSGMRSVGNRILAMLLPFVCD